MEIDARTKQVFCEAVDEGDAAALKELLAQQGDLSSIVDECWFSFCAPAIVIAAARANRELVDVLLEAGADINKKSEWDAGGFGVLDHTCFEHPDFAQYLISRGARVDVWAAAGLGKIDILTELLDESPELIFEKGPDGQQALHFAATTEVVDILLARGAEIDALCVDHGSTPVQHAAAKRPEVARYLLAKGARADIFVAAALNDSELVRSLVSEDPGCLSACLGRPGYEAVQPGNVMDWTLGWHLAGGRATPHRIARKLGHSEVFDLLFELSPPEVQVLAGCWEAETERVRALLLEQPGLAGKVLKSDGRALADAAWENDLSAVRLMLEVGFSPQVRGDHGSTPLDRAAFHGFAEIIRVLLEHDASPPLEQRNEFGSKPFETLVYGSVNTWRDDGDFPEAARLLIEAGSEVSIRHAYRSSRTLAAFIESRIEESEIERFSRPHLESDFALVQGKKGLLVEQEPHPAPMLIGSEGQDMPWPYLWKYKTKVTNTSGVKLQVLCFEGFSLKQGRWIPENREGRTLDGDDFVHWFKDAGTEAVLAAGETASCADTWHGAETPRAGPYKWAFRAIDSEGLDYYGETIVAVESLDK